MDSIDIISDLNGIAETTLTTGLTIGINEVTALIITSQEDSVNFAITTTPGAPHHIVKLSLEDSITVGNTRLLQVRVEDEFNNTIPGRVTDSLIVLYTFDEGSDTSIYDVSGVDTALNLSMENISGKNNITSVLKRSWVSLSRSMKFLIIGVAAASSC